MTSLKSSSLVPISFLSSQPSIRHRAHQYLLSKHKSTALPCKWQGYVNGQGNEMWAVTSDSSSLRQRKATCNSSPPAAIRWQSHKTDAAWITELLQEGQLIQNISQTHRGLWKQEIHFCCVKLLWYGGVCYHTKTQSSWQKELGG